MHIIGLKIENLRKISAIEMEFRENGVIPIIGQNESGKTTIRDALTMLFKGKKEFKQDMIQHGKNKAVIECQIPGFNIRRIITQKTDRLEVTTPDNLEKKKPAEFLSSLINELTFNPQPFMHKNSKEKLAFLMKLLDIDFTDIDNQIKTAEEERTILYREVSAIGDIPETPKAEMIPICDLVERSVAIEARNKSKIDEYEAKRNEEIKANVSFNNEQKQKEGKLSSLIRLSDSLNDEIKDLESQLLAVKEQLSAAKAEIDKRERPLPIRDIMEISVPYPELEDTENIRAQIQAAVKNNENAVKYENYLNAVSIKNRKGDDYKQKDSKIKQLRAEKELVLKKTGMPIAGLEIREDGVYFKGIHSDNWSTSQEFRIALELCEAMKPPLRAAVIDHGEAFDSEKIKELNDWAQKNDIQVILTRVDNIPETKNPNVFYIVEGELI